MPTTIGPPAARLEPEPDLAHLYDEEQLIALPKASGSRTEGRSVRQSHHGAVGLDT